MKDLLKRLFCIVMALTMVLCLVACGSTEEEEDTGRRGKDKETTGTTAETTEETEPEEPSIVGEWEAEIDLTDYMSDYLYEETDGMVELDLDECVLYVSLVINEDGTYEADMDASGMETAFVQMGDALWNAMLEAVATQAGCTVEQAEAAYASEGMTKEMITESITAESFMEEFFGDFDPEGEWVLEEDELYMAKRKPEKTDPFYIEFDGTDSFSVEDMPYLGVSMDEDMLDYILPVIFERV